MKFSHYDLGHRPGGELVQATLSGRVANIFFINNIKTYIFFLLALAVFFTNGCVHISNKPEQEPHIDIDKLLEEGRFEELNLFFGQVLEDSAKPGKELDLRTRMQLFLIRGRILEYSKQFLAARKNYESALKLLDELERGGEKQYILEHLRIIMLARLCYCCIETGYTEFVETLTQYVLTCSIDKGDIWLTGEIDEEKQYSLLKHCLFITHLFHTGNHEQFKLVVNKLRSLICKKKQKNWIVTSPWEYFTEIKSDDAFISMFEAYSKMQDANLTEISSIQERWEDFYESKFTKILLWCGQTLGVAKSERAMLLGFGGYGYSMLGKYTKSKSFFSEGIEVLESGSQSDPFKRLLLSVLYLGYVDSYLIPNYKNSEDGDSELVNEYLNKSERLLTEDFAPKHIDRILDPNLDYGVELAHTYRLLTIAKWRFNETDYTNCYINASEALAYLHPASPKQLAIDTIYYGILASLNLNKEADAFISKADEILPNYKGFELWKLYYAYSLLYEKSGDLRRALVFSKKSVAIIDTFRWNRFPNLAQQITFMEDKTLPYEQTIRLLLCSDLDAAEKESQIFEYVERVKIHSLLLLSEKARPFAEDIVSVEMLKDSLEPDEVFIELYLGSDFLVTLLVSKSITSGNGLIYHNISDDISDDKKWIDSSAKLIRENMAYEKTITSDRRELSRKIINENGYYLFKKLFAVHCARGSLKPGKKVYVSPHRVLNYLPWNALSVSIPNVGGDYMIDHYNISTLPCATALCKLKNKKKEKSQNQHNSFFIGPNVDCSNINEDYLHSNSKWKIYRGKKATAQAAIAELENSDTIIFLSHAFFEEDSPLKSYIKLAGRHDESFLTFENINNALVKANFIVLGGCATGKIGRYSELNFEKDEDGYLKADDLLGLSIQIISKDVTNLVFSSVDKTSVTETEKFLIALVQHINQGLAKPEATIKSIKEIKKNQTTNHPYYWGAYVLVGPF